MLQNIQIEIENMKKHEKSQERSLLQIQETTGVILAKINSEQAYREDPLIKDNKIAKYFPLMSIENFLELENMLKDDQEAFMQVVSKFLSFINDYVSIEGYGSESNFYWLSTLFY